MNFTVSCQVLDQLCRSDSLPGFARRDVGKRLNENKFGCDGNIYILSVEM